ncbi:MAG: PD-(D/E)XK nuclease family protein, partial [Ilumatobacteraceae bacterium]
AKLSAAQAAAEGVIGKERTIERLARSALAAPVVATGCRREHWRELFVATGFGTHVIEGYIDLLVRDDQGELTVVDYKTDQLSDAPDRSERLRRYGVQLAAYGIALEKLLGEPVRAGVLVLCRVNAAAQEHFVADWQATKDELRARLLLVD